MKRFLLLVVALASVAVLSSCALFGSFRSGTAPAAQDRGEQIADAITRRDADAVKGLFSTRAIEGADDLDAQVEYLLSLFPSGSEVTASLISAHGPRSVTSGEKLAMVTGMFEVTAGGEEFWMFLAEYTEDTRDPDNVGLYGLGVAPRTESGESDAELAMYEWNGQFGLGEGTPGVYVPQP